MNGSSGIVPTVDLGFSLVVFWSIEMAGDNLSTKTVLTYAKALGVSVSDIVTIDDRKRSVSSIEKQLEGFNLEQLQRIESYAHYLQTKIKENKTLFAKQVDSEENDEEQEEEILEDEE